MNPPILIDRASAFIDLIFIFQPDEVIDPGVNFSLYLNCHHKVVYAKYKLEIYYPTAYEPKVYQCQNTKFKLEIYYPSTYELKVYQCQKATTDAIWKVNIKNKYQRKRKDCGIQLVPHGATQISVNRRSPWNNNKIKKL